MVGKAAIYLRSSKDRHDVSIDSQRRELIRHAQDNGDVVVAEYNDKVESAKTANRPGFQQMMSDVKAPQRTFDKIYCYDTSRFSRRQYDAQLYKHLLKKESVELHYLKLPKSDPLMDGVLESLMEIFDEFHSQKSKLDGLRGMRENVEQGWRAGGRPLLGYQLENTIVGTREGLPITKSKLVPDPVLFPKIQALLKGRAQGVSRIALVKELDLDVPFSTLAYIENNLLGYAGHTVWNRHNERIDGKYVGGKRYRDRSEWVIKRNTHTPMITDAEAELIMEIRDKNRRKRFRFNDYLLSGLLYCACGSNMDGSGGYYRCRNRCGNRAVHQSRIEQAVVQFLLEIFLTEDATETVQTIVQQELKSPSGTSQRSENKLKKQVTEFERQISELLKLVTEVEHQRPLLDRINELESNRQALVDELQELQTAKPIPHLKSSKGSLRAFLAEYQEHLAGEDAGKKKAILQSMLDRAVLNRNMVEIYPAYESLSGGSR